jgi:hypothetical protein
MIYTRICPQCKKEIQHKHIISWKKSVKENKICFRCTRKNYCNSEEGRKKVVSNFGEPKSGKDNPFYGKKHSKKTRKLISEKCSRIGKDNGMYGKSVYSVWLQKYGEEEANNRMVKYKNKQSILNSGKNNSMYGKPSPQGSGNGWSGWYKEWYFRSLRELSYVINYLEKNNMKWETAEKKIFTIPYRDYDGKDRTYRPDFFVENKKLVEVKPGKLRQAVTNSLKEAAAKKFCKKNGYEYEITEAKRMEDDQIVGLYKKGLIKFTDRYEKKFKEGYLDGGK